jgi:PAS domain S-box-containing protein
MSTEPAVVHFARRNFEQTSYETDVNLVNRFFRLAVEQSPCGVLVLREDGTVLLVNPEAENIFGYSAAELLYRNIDQILPDIVEWRASGRWGLSDATAAEHTEAIFISSGLHKNGARVPIEISLSTVTEGRARFLVASATDISERLSLQARVAAAEHLDSERLIRELAVSFSGRLDDMDDAIVDSLRRLGEALHMDHVIVWRKAVGSPTILPDLRWQREGTQELEPVPVEEVPWFLSNIQQGEACWFSDVDEIPDMVDRESVRRVDVCSGALFPLTISADAPDARDLVALSFSSLTAGMAWPESVVGPLRVMAALIGQALDRKATHLALKTAREELVRLQDQLADDDGDHSRHEIRTFRSSRSIVSESDAVKHALEQLEQVAPTPATVLLLGETGAGKEVFAQAIHELSPRHARQMIRVSCAAIPSALIESEMFGRERGAYTGALSRQVGRFEAAHQSTLFLDEIGELPLEVQAKLLRVLQERTIERLGSTQPIKVDVRIIAATNRNLEQAVADKTFREDLFYRLNVFPITVPPLRERVADIPGLVWAFLEEFSRSFGKPIESVSKDTMRELQQYPWPGNVRELRNVIERAVIVATKSRLSIELPKMSPTKAPKSWLTLEALEIEHVKAVLESTNWRVRGPGGAAGRLGLKPTTLESRMARLGIRRQVR